MKLHTYKNRLTLGAVSILAAGLCCAAPAALRPNILIFYVDDLGWQDIQVNDVDKPCPYETPNIIKLAEAGMNFTQGYSPAPTCSPSRAGIITGQHPAQLGLTHVDLGVLKPGRSTEVIVPPYLEEHMTLDALTLATALKQNGYRTGHSGKWHVGLTADYFGFEVVDQDRGIHRGMDDRTKDFATADDGKYPLSKEKYPPFSQKKPNGISYPYDQVTESAIQFMKESGEQPFFMNLCHWMVHWPVLTRNGELLEYYCDKMGQPFPPKPGDMTLPGQQNPYFAAMVTSVDWSLGRVVDFLKQTNDPRNPGKKLIDTTYIFFSSDNGGVEFHQDEIISDNAPLKYGKKHSEEGGVRIPMIITGAGISSGSQFDGLVNQLDFFPTILNLTRSTIAAKDQQKLSGLDITPVLTGKSQKIVDATGAERDHLWWHFPHNSMDSSKSAIRCGDYKLYKRYATEDYELYRLYNEGSRQDLEEQTNLAENPEYAPVVQKLAAKLKSDLEETQAQGPYLNPAYKGKTKASAEIKKQAFNAANRQASVQLIKSGPAIETAYVIYRHAPGADKHAARRGGAVDVRIGMKQPATIDASGQRVSALIPKGIEAYCFLIIDENKYQTVSDIQLIR
jgi:arylsulfatase A-like enzyme